MLKKKKDKESKRKPKYGIFSCVGYIYRVLWENERFLVFAGIGVVPLSLIMSALGLYASPIIISAIENAEAFSYIAGVIIGVLIVQSLTGWLNAIVQNTIGYSEHYVMSILAYKYCEKLRLDDYYLENDPKYCEISERGGKAANDHTDGVWFPMRFAETLAEVLKFFLFSSVISLLHPAVILLLIAGAVINRKMSNWQWTKHWNERDERYKAEKKRDYMARSVSRDLKYQKEIRLFNMAESLSKRFTRHTEESMEWNRKHERRGVFVSIVEFVIVLLRDGLAYAFLIYKALRGEVEAAQFVLYFSAINQMAGLLGGIAWRFQQVKEGAMQISDYREFLDYKGKLNHGVGIPLPKKAFSIEFKNVSFKYPKGEKQILENVSFKIEPGEKIAIVGLNGAGKTTLVMLACGLLIPDSGEVLIDGHSIYEYNRDEMYSLFGLMPQEYNLLPVSLAKNIACTVDEEEIDRERLQHTLELSRFKEKVDSLPLGVETPLGRTINDDAVDLSGGEKQRLLLARLIYSNRLCMILDEPTAALDPIAEDKMYRRYNEISKNSTSIFISHRLASTRFCNRIFLLDGANFAEIGTHEELMAKGGKYRELFDVQSKYYQKELENNG